MLSNIFDLIDLKATKGRKRFTVKDNAIEHNGWVVVLRRLVGGAMDAAC